MNVQEWTFVLVALTFALYIGVAIWSRAKSTGEFYVAGKHVSPLANGMATAADWMSAASFIGMAGIIAFSVLVTLLSGSYAVWKGAGTVCSSWPFCTASSIIPQSFLGWVHMFHRIASSLTGLIGLYFLYKILKKRFSTTVFLLSIFSV